MLWEKAAERHDAPPKCHSEGRAHTLVSRPLSLKLKVLLFMAEGIFLVAMRLPERVEGRSFLSDWSYRPKSAPERPIS